MPEVMDRQAARQAWLEARKNGLGASDAAAVLGLSPWKSPLQLYTEKAGLTVPSQEETEAIEWGHRLEDPIAQKYQDETGRLIDNPGEFTIQHHPDLPFLTATLDRRVVGYVGAVPPDQRKACPVESIGDLEIKTAAFIKAEDWTEEPPLAYQIQVQHQLAVTGYKWGSIAVLIGGQMFRWQDIPRNDAFIAKLLAAEEDFWRRVVDKNPPEPDASESAHNALKALYPSQVRDTVPLPESLLEYDALRVKAETELAHWKEQKLLAENHIMAALGDYSFGILPNGVRYAWRVEPRKEHFVAASSPRVLRRSEPKAKKGKK